MAIAIMTYLYMYFGLGIILGLCLSLVLVALSKRKWRLLMINYEQRQQGMVCDILKGRKITSRDGKSTYLTKPTVLFSGAKVLFQRSIVMPPPKYSHITLGKNGGNVIISYSPTANVFLPIEFTFQEGHAKMIVKFELLKTWFKTAIIDLQRNKLLRPGLKWEKILPIAMMGMFIIVLIIWIIVMESSMEIVNMVNSNVGSWGEKLGVFSQNLGSAAGGVTAQTPTPVGG